MSKVSYKTRANKAREKHNQSMNYSSAVETIDGITYINIHHLTESVWKKLDDRQICAATEASFINRVLKPIHTGVHQRQNGDNSDHLTPVCTAALGAVEKKFGADSVYRAQNKAGTGIRFRGVKCIPEVMDFATERFKAYLAVAEDQYK